MLNETRCSNTYLSVYLSILITTKDVLDNSALSDKDNDIGKEAVP